jgi:hypothetical protein
VNVNDPSTPPNTIKPQPEIIVAKESTAGADCWILKIHVMNGQRAGAGGGGRG